MVYTTTFSNNASIIGRHVYPVDMLYSILNYKVNIVNFVRNVTSYNVQVTSIVSINA